MKTKLLRTPIWALTVFATLFMGCSDDDTDTMDPPFQGDAKSYALMSRADASISGTATFEENEDGTATVILDLSGTSEGSSPAHIHANSAAEGGDIAVSLEPVDGSTGMSTTVVTMLDNGTAITYDELLEFDGYINVHQSSDDLSTIIAQGDIGPNELTGTAKIYALGEKDVDGISGTATFFQRVDGNALAEIRLEGTPDGGMHPGHIHLNSAAEGGAIAFTFNPVDGTTGISRTHVEALDDGTPLGYAGVLEFDGYINVHLSADDLATLVAQGDIGVNELTGTSKVYELGAKDVEGIMGTATFFERVNGKALAVIELEGTPEDGMHPAHIHENTAAEGGAIAFTFNPVVGASGRSETNVESLDDETEIGFDDILTIDGYINVHLSADELATLVAQGDIGQNELTGESETYALAEVDVPGISGTATFSERVNGETLVSLDLSGTVSGGTHPAHIHAGSVAMAPGDILITLTSVSGDTGVSLTNVTMNDAEEAVTYADLVAIDGYINVHQSAADLATLIAQGDVGINAN